MKTLQQRLQSRISKRRNDIRDLEYLAKLYFQEGFRAYAKNLHQQVIELGKEQKLDKDLMNMVVAMNTVVGKRPFCTTWFDL